MSRPALFVAASADVGLAGRPARTHPGNDDSVTGAGAGPPPERRPAGRRGGSRTGEPTCECTTIQTPRPAREIKARMRTEQVEPGELVAVCADQEGMSQSDHGGREKRAGYLRRGPGI